MAKEEVRFLSGWKTTSMVLLQVRILPAPRKEFIDILDRIQGRHPAG